MKKYIYFVSYYYKTKTGDRYGNSEVSSDILVRGMNDLNAIADAVGKKIKAKGRPLILNFTLFRIEGIEED